jgi:hypothetical protein
MVDPEEAFLVGNIDIYELVLQYIVGKMHVSYDIFLPMILALFMGKRMNP